MLRAREGRAAHQPPQRAPAAPAARTTSSRGWSPHSVRSPPGPAALSPHPAPAPHAPADSRATISAAAVRAAAWNAARAASVSGDWNRGPSSSPGHARTAGQCASCRCSAGDERHPVHLGGEPHQHPTHVPPATQPGSTLPGIGGNIAGGIHASAAKPAPDGTTPVSSRPQARTEHQVPRRHAQNWRRHCGWRRGQPHRRPALQQRRRDRLRRPHAHVGCQPPPGPRNDADAIAGPNAAHAHSSTPGSVARCVAATTHTARQRNGGSHRRWQRSRRSLGFSGSSGSMEDAALGIIGSLLAHTVLARQRLEAG